MSYPQTSDPIPLPVPIGGMNRRDPLAKMDPLFAPWILNFDPEPQYLRIRNGYVRHADLGSWAAIGLGAYGETKLFAYTLDALTGFNRIYDVTTSTPVLADTALDDTNILISPVLKYGAQFAFTASSDAADCARAYNGSTWAAWGFTSSAVAIPSIVGCSYKGRVYLFSGKNMYYSALAAVTGACTLVDLSSLFVESGEIVWCGVLTDATNKPTEQSLAIGTAQGETLIYAGDYPGAANWQIVARLDTPPPLYYNSILQYRGDIWVATVTGIISVRQAASVGANFIDEISVSSAIDPYWRQLVAAIVSYYSGFAYSWRTYPSYVSMAFWPEQNRIYVLVGGELSADSAFTSTRGTMFVYNGYSKAWTIHQMPQITSPRFLAYFKDNIYFTAAGAIMKVGTGFKDQNFSTGNYHSYPYALHSAYMDLNSGKKKLVRGFEPLINTDFAGADVTMKAASDFGRKVSAATSNALQTGYQSPLYSVGINGEYVQYRLEGNSTQTATAGLELYSVGVVV